MNSHVVIISLLVAIIVGIQIGVFVSTMKRINLFKQILPKVAMFNTVKVYIPEEYIENSTPEDIFKNLSHFNQKPVALDELKRKEEGEKDILTFSDETDTWVRIYLGFETKRIKSKNLPMYKDEGWAVISDNSNTN